jgi:hypothetical protein
MLNIKTATVAALLTTFMAAESAPLLAQGRWDRDRDRRERKEDREDRRRRAERERRAAREYQREVREARREYLEDVRDARRDYWDASRYYRRDDRRYRPRRLGRNDWVYRGSDYRYYCRRDDGTTGLIIGGVSGAVLGNILAPGGAKVLGTIIGGGAGALIGRAIDDGDMVCR